MSIPLRILVVDDSEEDALREIRELRQAGYEPSYRRVNTAEALAEALQNQQWEAIICAHAMVSLSSSAAVGILQQSGLDLPFIVVSETIREEEALALMRGGVHDYIHKAHLARLVPAIEREVREAAVRSKRREAERALKASEERYRLLIETSPDSVVVTDLDGVISFTNERTTDITGYDTAMDLLGMSVFDLIAPEDRDHGIVDFHRVLQEGAIKNAERVLIRRDGSRVLTESRGALLRGDDGSVTGVTLVVRDVTECVRARQENERLAEENASRARELAAIIEHVPCGVAVCDATGHIVLMNGVARQITRLTLDSTGSARDQFSGFTLYDAESGEAMGLENAAIHRALRGEVVDHLNYVLRRPDGGSMWIQAAAVPLTDAGGSVTGAVTVFSDVTPERRLLQDLQTSQWALKQREALYRTLVETSPDAIILRSEDGTILMANKRAGVMHGYDDHTHLIGLHLLDLIAPEERHLIAERMKGLGVDRVRRNVEHLGLRKDGTTFPAEASVSLLPASDDQPASVVIVIRDITVRKELEDRLRYQALHDPLTGLPNATWLQQHLEDLLEEGNGVLSGTLLLLDLVGFKEINDTFGHQHGNRLLQQLADRLRDTAPEGTVIARFSGDSFALVLGCTTPDEALLTVEQLVRAVAERFVIDDQSFHLESAIGIARFPEDGADPAVLLRCADVAMSEAQRTNSPYTFYSASHDTCSAARLRLMADLHQAIADDQLVLYYQPKVVLGTGRVEGAEALVRWLHPTRGLIPPDQFIRLAETGGLIRSLTRSVLSQALQQAHIWHDQGLDLTVAVNLSARNLHDVRLVADLDDMFHRIGADPSWLTVEITESAVMVDADRALETLTALHELGVGIAIDDFGTGYSSLAYLKRLPVDEIKIDRSFVTDMIANRDDAFIVRTVIDLGHNLGLKVVAEGIETQQVLDVLAVLGCDLVQGYFLSPPIPPEALPAWLQERNHESIRKLTPNAA